MKLKQKGKVKTIQENRKRKTVIYLWGCIMRFLRLMSVAIVPDISWTRRRLLVLP